MGSTLNTVAPLEIPSSGSVVATDGGLFTLPSANFNGPGASIEAKGAQAEFRSAGATILRKGRVMVFQGGQGRAEHLTLHNGTGSVIEDNSLLTLSGNLEVGIEGQSSFDIGSGGKVVSDAGFV